MIDTHCHLTSEAFNGDLETVLSSAFSAGIDTLIIPAVDLESSRKAVSLAHKYPQLYAAVGVHPEELDGYSNSCWDDLRIIAEDERVAAIGEIGLDFHYPPIDEARQAELLKQMLSLALSVNKPVLVHSRDSMKEVLNILGDWSKEMKLAKNERLIKAPGILHAFEGSLEQAEAALEMNYLLGMGGPITYKNPKGKDILARTISLDHLVLETDAPYLPPHPHRGERNEPKYLKLIALKLAEIKSLPYQMVAEATTKNAKRIFNLEE